MSINSKTATVKYNALKNKAKSLAATKVIKFKKKGQGKMSYTLVSAKKGSKNYTGKFEINKTTGKVKLSKGLNKGTYKVKVEVKAAGNSNYEPSESKIITFKVKVK